MEMEVASKDLRQKQQTLNKLHIRAKHTGDRGDWNNYKNCKATLNKEISKQRNNYINNKLDNSGDRLKTIQDINDNRWLTYLEI